MQPILNSIKPEIQRRMEYHPFYLGGLTHFVLGLIWIKILIANFSSSIGWSFKAEKAAIFKEACVKHSKELENTKILLVMSCIKFMKEDLPTSMRKFFDK